MTHVDSTSDARTVNNTMRHAYRVLSDEEKAQMQDIKDIGASFLSKLYEISEGAPNCASGKPLSRELSFARTKIEEAVMWAVKHVTA